MKLRRGSGLLMHISSLPGNHGIGTLGREAYEFIDLLVEGGQKYWQILPMGPVSATFGYSPYSSFSSFACNYLLINLEMVQKEDWMRNYIMSDFPQETHNDFVEFEKIESFKLPLLKKAADNFFKYADKETKNQFKQFCETSRDWLEDYALFMSLGEHYNSFNWLTWDEKIRFRQSEAIGKWQKTLKIEMDFFKFSQFIFFKQWENLKNYAQEQGIKIIGDLPIYVILDSVDAWSNPEIFQLEKRSLKPRKVAGVPPDYFSKTGQRWGNPIYQWYENGTLKKETMDWWEDRIKYMLQVFDMIRLDHFRGFESYWAIPEEEDTAVKGQWEKGPGLSFFESLKERLGEKISQLPLITEDLGIITPPVEKLRDDLGLPGMKVLQFAFDMKKKNAYLPNNYTTTNCVVYTGTHDNNTTNGWFYENEIDERVRSYILRYLRINHKDEFHWQLINLALSSIAKLSIFPVQDILGYAGKFRMNTPGRTSGNWRWKLTPGRLTPKVMNNLKERCILYNRH
jgi:4-alpha-glucanotransferase